MLPPPSIQPELSEGTSAVGLVAIRVRSPREKGQLLGVTDQHWRGLVLQALPFGLGVAAYYSSFYTAGRCWWSGNGTYFMHVPRIESLAFACWQISLTAQIAFFLHYRVNRRISMRLFKLSCAVSTSLRSLTNAARQSK